MLIMEVVVFLVYTTTKFALLGCGGFKNSLRVSHVLNKVLNTAVTGELTIYYSDQNQIPCVYISWGDGVLFWLRRGF